MAASPEWKVYNADGEYLAATKDTYIAAATHSRGLMRDREKGELMSGPMSLTPRQGNTSLKRGQANLPTISL